MSSFQTFIIIELINTGFKEMPQVGEEFFVGEKTEEEIKKADIKRDIKSNKSDQEKNENTLNLILKADTVGSLEAMKKF